MAPPPPDVVIPDVLDLSQAAIDSLPGVFYVFTAEGKFLRWSRGLEVASGYEAAEIARMKPLDLIREADREVVAKNIANVFEVGEAKVAACLLSRDGEEKPFFFSGKQIVFDGTPCLIGMGIDMTEQRRAIDALRHSEERLRAIIEQSPISMAIVSMDGTIEYINRRAIETFGYLPEDIPVMDRWWEQAYPDAAYRAEVTTQWMGLVGRAIELGTEIERREYRVTCKDRTVKTMVIFGVITTGKVFVMFEDITARKEAEEARARAEEQVHRVHRMEALGTLSGGIAHDFNNILMGVLPNAELLLRQLPEGDTRRVLAGDILQASIRARDLVRQILAYARREAPELRPLALAPVVEETLKLLHASLPPNVHIRVRTTAPSAVALIEPSQVQQVVTNLATNAAHAIGHASGNIVIAIDTSTLEASDCVSYPEMRPGSFVCLTISDDGCGMSKETLARAFEPFFTTKPIGQGTGLGLSIVHGIMTRHKGFVVAESTVGAGATFKLYFPAYEAAIEASRADPTALDGPSTTRLRILLVDDDATVIRAASRALLHFGFSVVATADPTEALTHVRQATFDLAIVDLAMPEMYGDELSRRILALQPRVRILLASGNASALDRDKLAESGIGEVLEKPYDMAELRAAIDRTLARS